MLENTLENKAKFIAHYYGQEVFRFSVTEELLVVTKKWNWQNEKCFLHLKSLSSITDGEAASLAYKFNITIGNEFLEEFSTLEEFKQHLNTINVYYCHRLDFFDYLRSKGYALPFMGLSVENQLEYGWIKLISKN